MVAALVRALGTQDLALTEDAVQDVLCPALEAWKYDLRLIFSCCDPVLSRRAPCAPRRARESG
jgi:predicted RNA polymerase sigma factor